MNSAKIKIGDQSYTKTELRKHCKRILKCKAPKLITGIDKNICEWCLFQQQPEIRKYVNHIRIEVRYYRGYNCFHYSISYRPFERYSYKKALERYGKERITIPRSLYKKAFRFAVYNQTNSFKLAELDKVENNHYKKVHRLDPKAVHTDHHVIPFFVLLDDFLRTEELVFEDCELIHHENIDSLLVLADKELVSRWQKFHQKHAILRLRYGKDNVKEGNNLDLKLYQYRKKIGLSK